MTREVTKEPRVALCRMCHGSGKVPEKATGLFGPRRQTTTKQCPQCEGSGRVIVSCKMELDIKPYKPRT